MAKPTRELKAAFNKAQGRLIIKAINDRGLQQKDVAAKAGLPKSSLNEAISGKRGLDIPQVDLVAKAIYELSGKPCSRAELQPPDEIAHVVAATGPSRGKLEGEGKPAVNVRGSADEGSSLHPRVREFLADHAHEFTSGQISFLRDGFNFGPDAVLDDQFFYDLIRAHTARMERKARGEGRSS